jgi:hypothetical protein
LINSGRQDLSLTLIASQVKKLPFVNYMLKPMIDLFDKKAAS